MMCQIKYAKELQEEHSTSVLAKAGALRSGAEWHAETLESALTMCQTTSRNGRTWSDAHF